MLRRYDDSGRGLWLAFIVVAQGHLAFGIGLKKRRSARMAVCGHALKDLVAVIQRRGHQVRGFSRGIAEHDALVASAFILVVACVYTLRDMCRLAVQVIFEAQGFPVEARLRVADFLNGAADCGFNLFLRAFGPLTIFVNAFAANFAREHNQLRGGQGFARDACFGIFG